MARGSRSDRSRRGRRGQKPPEGKIRRSQVVTTYGPGAMIDLVHQAVLVGGLDFWSRPTDPALMAPRLRDAIAERFRPLGWELSEEAAFFQPPQGDDKQPSPHVGIQALEFPRWFVCQNPPCRALVHSSGLETRAGRYRHDCSRTQSGECVPVRFVAACPRGHLEEFPWVWFAHSQRGSVCPGPSLRLLEGATGDFSEISVECAACGASAGMAAALVKHFLPLCRGHRPWLGEEGQDSCDQPLRLLVRTASNAYFAQVVSALSVPEKGRELEEAVQGVWDVLKAATAEVLPAFRQIPKVDGALASYSDSEILAVVEALRRGEAVARAALRTAEFQQFVAQPMERPGEGPGEDEEFYARAVRPRGALPPGIARIVLARKLREVRAQVGFTRIAPTLPDLEGEFDLNVQSAPLGLATDWLPATEIRGEGVFLQLDEAAVRQWEERPEVQARGRELLSGYQSWLTGVPVAPPFPGVRFYLLHSLSHLLLSAISLECGYSASAIRERIYCAPAEVAVPMAALLLSTGSSGTEGTLGGLVQQGLDLPEHLGRAWDLGLLCSSDPVCGAHSPDRDPEERFLEGAACHGCLFLAECSCERFNHYLDRALVVPTLGQPAALAFFAERP